jgi:hypothetical protein
MTNKVKARILTAIVAVLIVGLIVAVVNNPIVGLYFAMAIVLFLMAGFVFIILYNIYYFILEYLEANT